MPGLAATGTLSYNNYVFDGASEVKSRVEFIYDEGQRTITAHKHLITVVAVVANDGGLDSDLLSIRRRLGKSGKCLKFINKGFGDDLTVNCSSGGVQDVKFGPHPRMLAWHPIGDDNAAEIEWEVETTVPVCVNANYSGILALNYRADFTINEHGDTTRTIAGYIEIAQSATRGRDVWDNYRELIVPPPIPGFRRQHTFNGSLNRQRADFTIVDEQIPSPNPYPVGVTAITGNHRFSFRPGSDRGRMRNVISCAITPQAGLSGAVAYQIFLNIAVARLEWARNRGAVPIMTDLEVDEDLFGRAHSFRLGYWFTGCISDFMGRTGLWRPLGTDWRRWALSLQNSMFSPRGNVRLEDPATADIIMDLCDNKREDRVAAIDPNQFIPRAVPGIIPIIPVPGRRRASSRRGGLTNKTPSLEASWLQFESQLRSSRRRPVSRQSILRSPDQDEDNWLLNGDPAPAKPTGYGRAGTPDTLQVGGGDRYTFWLVGRAMRVGHHIPRPAIEKVGSQTPVERSAEVQDRTVGNFFGVPVYEKAWAVEYDLPASPGQVYPPNDEAEWVDSPGNRVNARA